MMDANPPETGSLDLLYLLDRLEEVLSRGSRLPFTSRALIDDDACFGIVDQIRLSLPNEIRLARKTNADRETIVAEAQARARQIIEDAEQEAHELARDHQITREAEAHAREIILQAQREAERIRREADEYAFRVLSELDRRLESVAAVVRNGIESLQASATPDAAADEPRDLYGR